MDIDKMISAHRHVVFMFLPQATLAQFFNRSSTETPLKRTQCTFTRRPLTLKVQWHQMVTFKIVQCCHSGLTYIFDF